MNPELALARFFFAVFCLLVAYLIACGLNSLGEIIVRAWRQHRRSIR